MLNFDSTYPTPNEGEECAEAVKISFSEHHLPTVKGRMNFAQNKYLTCNLCWAQIHLKFKFIFPFYVAQKSKPCGLASRYKLWCAKSI